MKYRDFEIETNGDEFRAYRILKVEKRYGFFWLKKKIVEKVDYLWGEWEWDGCDRLFQRALKFGSIEEAQKAINNFYVKKTGFYPVPE